MDGTSAAALARRRGRTRARLAALVACAAVIGAGVWIQASWRISPPVGRSALRQAARSMDPARRQPLGAVAHRIAPGSSPVVLTEVSTVNHDVILDDDLAPSDWVELYNRSDAPVSLAGWRLVETGRPRRGWVFPRLTLAPRTYLIVWASGKDRVGGAASRRLNTQITREARVHHIVDDFHTPLPTGVWAVRRARRVRVEVPVPEAGDYTLWLKARARGLSGAVRVRVHGARSKTVTVPGGRHRHLVVGAEGGVRIPEPGVYSVDVVARTGAVDVAHLALARAGPFDDRYAHHVHASFRLGRSREGVMLVDSTGVVRDELMPMAHPATATLAREAGSRAWRVGLPTPGGRTFAAGPDLSPYPSLSRAPFRVAPNRPPGVEELRYTLDGAVPTAASPRLDRPVEVTRPTALRLRGFTGGEPVTPIVTRQFWVGAPPAGPTVMLALDPRLIWDAEFGIAPNDRWRRHQELPDDPALGPFRLTRSRVWARERRQWIKPAHLLAVDAAGPLFDGRARVRRFTTAVGPGMGFHVRTREPRRPERDLFDRSLPQPGRSFLLDEDALNMPAYDVVRAAGGLAPRTAWGALALNGGAPAREVLIEPIDEDFLLARWGHVRFDLVKGKTFAAKRGTMSAFDALGHRLRRGQWRAADLASRIDLADLRALHLATLFLGTGDHSEVWQTHVALDRTRTPPLLHAIGWDLDHAMREGPRHDTAGLQRAYFGDTHRGPHRLVAVVWRLLQRDPEFRHDYLREAERVVNHVLTPAWWDAKRREPGWAADPQRAEEITRFFRERPDALFASLARALGLPPPRAVRVEVRGPGTVTIDGHAWGGAYAGRYLQGAVLELAVPPAGRAAFRHFTVNGRPEPGPVLGVPVTEDLEVVAWFGG